MAMRGKKPLYPTMIRQVLCAQKERDRVQFPKSRVSSIWYNKLAPTFEQISGEFPRPRIPNDRETVLLRVKFARTRIYKRTGVALMF